MHICPMGRRRRTEAGLSDWNELNISLIPLVSLFGLIIE
jgi:hypothetical protein